MEAQGERGLTFQLRPVGRSIRLFLAFGTFAGVCEAVYLAEVFRPVLLLDMALTRANWWGIVTSLFVHLSPWHIANDAGSIVLLAALMFALANWRRDWDPPITALCVFPFVSAVLANCVFYFVSPNPMSAGSSGVGYAMMGVALGYSLDAAITSLGEVSRKRGVSDSFKEAFRPVALYLGVSATMTAQILLSPAVFLNAVPGVNYGVHGVSFVFGMVSMLIYDQLRHPGGMNTKGLRAGPSK